jgi:hypothetical protein
MTNLYAILDTGTVGSIIHNVVSIDISNPNNITYLLFGTIAGFSDKYLISATLDPISSKIFFVLSDSDSNTSVENIYLYSVTFPDLLTVTPFCINNTVYVNINPQITYNVTDNLFYYAINNDPLGYDYKVNTIDSDGNIVVTNINTTNVQNSTNGLQIFKDYIYATYRPGNSFSVYYAGINNNTTGSITSPITPQPRGQLFSTFDLNGVLFGVTQYNSSSPPGYSMYRLVCVVNDLPASDPFISELVGDMPDTFDSNFIVNMTLFTPSACIHGSSKVLLFDKIEKQISELTPTDVILCPNNKYAKIKQIIPCWNGMPDQPSHDMIVFEKDSICQDVPNEKFAIDPDHPMCKIDEYLKSGNKAMRPSKKFINNKTIRRDKIDNIHNKGIMDKNLRYDLILEDSDVYIANNVVVKARLSFKQKGY